MKPKFGPGDKVFAKVRGYPPWPARVEGLADETPNRMRYHIYFYGTGETGIVKAEDICSFVENRGKLGKPKKHKNFTDALIQIEAELSPSEVKASLDSHHVSTENEHDDSSVNDDTSLSNTSRRSSTSSKSGKNSVPHKNREKKRKAEVDTPGVEDGEQKKTKSSTSQNNSVDVESTSVKSSPEVMSRSGRKIKPKRFADFEDLSTDETSALPSKSSVKSAPPKPVNKPIAKTDTQEKLPEKVSDLNFGEDYLIADANGEKTRIPLKLNAPNFKSAKAAQDWKKVITGFAMSLKKRIENGETLSEPAEKQMENWTRKKLEEYNKNMADNENKLKQLKLETQLLDIDSRLKGSLSLNRAEPDKCLHLLDELLELDFSSLMLKKHPEVVETIKKMRKYIGNTSHWNLEDEELIIFNSKAALIRTKSEHIYNKIKTKFLVPAGKSFWEVFALELEHFNKNSEGMTMNEVFSLVEDQKEDIIE